MQILPGAVMDGPDIPGAGKREVERVEGGTEIF
jgi:hypothetical protein